MTIAERFSKILDVIKTNPGIVAVDIHKKTCPEERYATFSSWMSTLYASLKIARSPVKASFRYWMRDVAPPGALYFSKTPSKTATAYVNSEREGHRNDAGKRRTKVGLAHGKMGGIAIPGEIPAKVSSDVLVVIPHGNNQSVTFTVTEAQAVYQQLRVLFER
jgi:hypothetical protein